MSEKYMIAIAVIAMLFIGFALMQDSSTSKFEKCIEAGMQYIDGNCQVVDRPDE